MADILFFSLVRVMMDLQDHPDHLDPMANRYIWSDAVHMICSI